MQTPYNLEKFIIRQPLIGEKDDYDSENSWISDGLPSRRRGDGRWESGESSEVHERPSVTSTAPKARSRSRGVATLDEAPRMSLSLKMSSKLPTLVPSSLASVITALARTSACLSTTVAFARTSASSLTPSMPVSFDFNVSYSSCSGYSSINTLQLKKKIQRRDGEPRNSKRRCDTMLDFA